MGYLLSIFLNTHMLIRSDLGTLGTENMGLSSDHQCWFHPQKVVLVCPGQKKKSLGDMFNPKSLPVFRCAASSLYVNVPDGCDHFFPRMTWA